MMAKLGAHTALAKWNNTFATCKYYHHTNINVYIAPIESSILIDQDSAEENDGGS